MYTDRFLFVSNSCVNSSCVRVGEKRQTNNYEHKKTLLNTTIHIKPQSIHSHS